MPIKARSLTFSPSLVDALLSVTALALNSCEKKSEHKHLCKHGKHKQTQKKEEKKLRHFSTLLSAPVSG